MDDDRCQTATVSVPADALKRVTGFYLWMWRLTMFWKLRPTASATGTTEAFACRIKSVWGGRWFGKAWGGKRAPSVGDHCLPVSSVIHGPGKLKWGNHSALEPGNGAADLKCAQGTRGRAGLRALRRWIYTGAQFSEFSWVMNSGTVKNYLSKMKVRSFELREQWYKLSYSKYKILQLETFQQNL